jgi:hypothetical protein
MLHDLNPASPAILGGTELSRFQAREPPVSLCKKGFAASMPPAAFDRFGAKFVMLTLN